MIPKIRQGAGRLSANLSRRKYSARKKEAVLCEMCEAEYKKCPADWVHPKGKNGYCDEHYKDLRRWYSEFVRAPE